MKPERKSNKVWQTCLGGKEGGYPDEPIGRSLEVIGSHPTLAKSIPRRPMDIRFASDVISHLILNSLSSS